MNGLLWLLCAMAVCILWVPRDGSILELTHRMEQVRLEQAGLRVTPLYPPPAFTPGQHGFDFLWGAPEFRKDKKK
jgi:hypothetical protein